MYEALEGDELSKDNNVLFILASSIWDRSFMLQLPDLIVNLLLVYVVSMLGYGDILWKILFFYYYKIMTNCDNWQVIHKFYLHGATLIIFGMEVKTQL